MKIIERNDNIVTIDYEALEDFISNMEAKLERLNGDNCFYTERSDFELCMELVDCSKVSAMFECEGLPAIYFKDYNSYSEDEINFDSTVDLYNCPDVADALSTWDSIVYEAKTAITAYLSRLKQLVGFCADVD